MSTPPFQILPELATDDFNRLKASIRERGVEVPVVVDEDGEIIDGHNRAVIADSLGIEYPTIVRAGLSVHEKRLLAVELNLARRHLTDAQKALMGERIEDDIAALARQRMAEAGSKAAPGKPATDVTPFQPKRTTDEVARTVGLGSGRTYERAKETIATVREQAPELVPFVERGDLDLTDVRRELKSRQLPRHIHPEAYAVAAAMTPEQAAAFDAETVRTTEPHAVGKALLDCEVALRRADRLLRGVTDDQILKYIHDATIREVLRDAPPVLAALTDRFDAIRRMDRGGLRRVQ